MNCPKCGALLDDDSKFCVSCGANLEVEVETKDNTAANSSPAKKAKTKPSTAKSLTKLIALAVGTILIIIGLIRVCTAGTSISSTSFGGDFYTYTYQGIVAISEILASIEATLGWVIVSIGAAIDVSALRH